MKAFRIVPVVLVLTTLAWADGPQDNLPDNVRRIPPPGVKIPDADRKELEDGVARLGEQIDTLEKNSLEDSPEVRAITASLLPDVKIFHKAVAWALKYDELYDAKEVATARAHLKQGMERAAALAKGEAPWTTATGLIARGYVSKIDGSVQPYGILVPAGYSNAPGSPSHRLDLWCHGRGEKLTELAFLANVQRSGTEFQPKDAFVLQLYGRYCNANKFAGEVDALEAMAAVKKGYRIDEDRVVMRGFSMGGAACWQFAVHYTDLWAAAAPGAGFSETQDFLKVFQNEPVKPTWYEQKLWHWYDCTDYAANLANLPTVAYSGENDRQKQAADMMARAMKAEGLELTHVIGPKTGHSYEKGAKEKINAFVDEAVARGRAKVPLKLRFTTWTLRYNRMHWLTVNGLGEHWERARVEADLPKVTTTNVTDVSFRDSVAMARDFELDGQKFDPRTLFVHKSGIRFVKQDGKWVPARNETDDDLRKRHGLQGPIDDAFMDSFLMVRPTGKPLNEAVGKWAADEMAHAIDHWRRQFRGDARVTDDRNVTDADIAAHNLVLWGDPSSNAVLAKVIDKLPLRWTAEGLDAGGKRFGPTDHVPVMVYPNPLNPKRYVVVNSGFTFREYDYLNNARQVPKLPDWAVIDVRTPPSSRSPGKVAAAGFFDERWQFKKTEP